MTFKDLLYKISKLLDFSFLEIKLSQKIKDIMLRKYFR